MNMRVLAALCVCVLTFALCSTSVLAQSQENGLIVVVVKDAATGKPIDNAQVFLLGGDTPQSSLTNAKGLLLLQNIQPGIYHVVVKASGYRDSDTVEADVGEAQRVNIAVSLVSSMRVIASVVARGSTSVTTEDINADSPERIVSPSLVDALGKLAGVNIEDDLYGSDSAFNISLHGADASQTAYSVDGVQVHGAASQAVGGFQDLFGGASVDFSPSAAAPAGMVSFFTAQPTKLWSYHFTGVVGNYGNTQGTWLVTGGGGKAAFALEHTGGGRDNPLNGTWFADSTGAAYEHLGGFARVSDLFKAAVSLSPATSVKYSVLSGNNTVSTICASETTLLPCGYGPNDRTHGGNLMQSVSLSSILGHFEYNAFYNRGTFTYATSEPNRAINGALSPFTSSSSSTWWTGGMYTSTTVRHHTLSGGFYREEDGGRYRSSYNGSGTASDARTSQYSSIWLGNSIKSNDKFKVDYNVSQASGTGTGTNLQFYGNTTWQPSASEAYSFGVGIGSSEPAPTLSGIVGDPLTAEYDCYNKSVFVNGPGDEATHQSSLEYNASWQHKWKRGQFTVNAYRNRFDGQGMFGAVPFAAEPPSMFPGGAAAYLGSLEQVWSQPSVCGGAQFDPSRVYVRQYISGLDQLNQGYTMSGRVTLNRSLMALANYSVSSAAIVTMDPRLLVPGSYYTAGAQVPHQPLRTAGVSLVGVVPHERLEWIVNAQFTAANNWQNLPAYTLYNAGLIVNLQRGSLRFTAANIFGTHTGLFTTYQGVNPVPVQGGGSFALATTPLAPRTFSLQYDVHWQQRAPKPKKKP
jgi:hypothetical protein